MRLHRTRALAAGVTLAATGLGAATAQASPSNVVTTVKAQEQIIRSSPAYRQLQNLKITTKAQAKVAIPTFAALDAKLKTAASAVSAASTTTPQQKQGQTDWVKGVRDLATGISDIEIGLKDAVANQIPAGKKEILKAAGPLKRAAVLSHNADVLLGLQQQTAA
jgi:hypothetical protein